MKKVQNCRRKALRFDAPLEVKFKTSTGLAGHYYGSALNFSRKGFCFESEYIDLEVEKPLEMNLRLPLEEKFVSVKGEMMWKERYKDKWRAGIRLNSMDSAAKREVLDFCYDMWLDKMRSM